MATCGACKDSVKYLPFVCTGFDPEQENGKAVAFAALVRSEKAGTPVCQPCGEGLRHDGEVFVIGARELKALRAYVAGEDMPRRPEGACALCGWKGHEADGLKAEDTYILGRAEAPGEDAFWAAVRQARKGRGLRICPRCGAMIRAFGRPLGLCSVVSPEKDAADRKTRVADFVKAQRAKASGNGGNGNGGGHTTKAQAAASAAAKASQTEVLKSTNAHLAATATPAAAES